MARSEKSTTKGMYIMGLNDMSELIICNLFCWWSIFMSLLCLKMFYMPSLIFGTTEKWKSCKTCNFIKNFNHFFLWNTISTINIEASRVEISFVLTGYVDGIICIDYFGWWILFNPYELACIWKIKLTFRLVFQLF